MEVAMAAHRFSRQKQLLDPHQGRYVLGALGLLIAVVGQQSCLGIILQQARSEVASLLRSQEQAANGEELLAA
jgi:hypothetical protein